MGTNLLGVLVGIVDEDVEHSLPVGEDLRVSSSLFGPPRLRVRGGELDVAVAEVELSLPSLLARVHNDHTRLLTRVTHNITRVQKKKDE